MFELVSPEILLQSATDDVDIGTASARFHLLKGWSWDAKAGDGTTYAWSDGAASEVLVWLGERRALEIELHGWPFTFEGAPLQTVSLEIRGPSGRTDLGCIELKTGPATYRLSLPVEVAEPGTNVLTLRYGYHRSPRDVLRSDDDRSLAVAWSHLRIVGPGGDDPVRDGGRLTLPRGSTAARFAEVPALSQLRLQADLEPDARLHVEWQPAGASVQRIQTLESSGRHVIDLRPGEPTLAALRLRASRGSVTVHDAEVWSSVDDTSSPGSVEQAATAEGGKIEPPHIVLVVIDTLRRDALGAYRQESPSAMPSPTPHFDRLSERSYLFDDAMTPASWTRPSVASIFTGQDPLSHGVISLDSVLADEALTLAEALSGAGYWTAGHSTNAHLVADRGFDQGFERFTFQPLDADEMVGVAEDLLDAAPERRPQFLYLHLLDPHAPFEPREDLRQVHAPEVTRRVGTLQHLRDLGAHREKTTPEITRDLRSLYEAEVAWSDEFLGHLLELLDQRGLTDETALVVASDHGEAFGEHGVFGHAWDLHSEVVRIPLLLHLPGQTEGRRVQHTVSLSDLWPTLVGLSEGRIDLPGVAQTGGPLGRTLVVHQTYEGRDAVAVVTSRYKLILPLSDEYGVHPLLFDRRDDPGDRVDLARERPVITGFLREIAWRELASASRPEERSIDAETRRALEELGYLDG